MSKLAVVLIRGFVGMRHDMKLTLRSLNIDRKHACAIVDDTLVVRGMLVKLQNYVAYGPVSEETIKALDAKRQKNNNNVYFLAPPKGGFERKGIKKAYTVGGALGDRGEAMNDLVIKML